MTRHEDDGSLVHQHVCNENEVYVVSEDIQSLLMGWADEREFTLPLRKFFTALRHDMKKKLQSYFPVVHFISEVEIKSQIDNLLEKETEVTAVSLDRAYKKNGCLLIEATRIVDGSSMMPIGNLGSRTQTSLEEQFKLLSKTVTRPIQLIDDVIFSGNSNIDLLKRFNSVGIEVNSMVVGISVEEGVRLLEMQAWSTKKTVYSFPLMNIRVG